MVKQLRPLLAVCLCALLPLLAPAVATAMPSPNPAEHPFAITPGSFSFTTSSPQAGAHSDWTTAFDFNHNSKERTYNDVRTTVVEVPAGFDASSTAVPTCSLSQLIEIGGERSGVTRCPVSSQVGKISIDISAAAGPPDEVTVPLYNMEVTSFGVAAELGFRTALITQILTVAVRPGDEGLTVTSRLIAKEGEARKIKATVWGIPAAHEHDAERGESCGPSNEHPPICQNEFGGPQPAGTAVKPFLSNPTSCGTFTAKLEADSWEEPDSWSLASDEVGPIVECERVSFDPSLEAQPTTRAAESPSGLNLSIVVPQTWENPFTIATSNLNATRVTLPEGMTANPGLAEGLAACSPQQYAAETSSSPPGGGCPDESKIGSITIDTPLLAEKIPGAVYIATPYDNVPEFGDPQHPGGSLLALYVVAKDPQRGILVKLAGKIEPDENTGRLVTTFQNAPQQPFSKFTLAFRPGAAAPLISPPACGEYAVQGALTPWSALSEPRFLSSPAFDISQGAGEGPCPSGGLPPFDPQVISGTQNNAAGSYSPFYLRLLRKDGEQELVSFSTTLPPGLSGNLSAVQKCPDSAIDAARQRTGGEEEANPSCPAASEIGHTLVGAGVGTVLAQNPGKVYLAGPYHGAPLSIVSITSAKVGPFDLGTVVIRFALEINPITAQVEISGAQSDPIPHIIKGIVVHVRDIRTYIDRPNFMINPTDCERLRITDAITGSGASYANPTGQQTVNVAAPFQAADCANLEFKPGFQVATTGKTSKTMGASLVTKLTFPSAPQGTQANIAKVKVELPKQLPSRLTTLQKACLAATFEANPAACPPASVIGHAKAVTPVLPVPLEGPAYFVSYGNLKFPELVVVLQGYGITVDLHGETFISKDGVTSTTFKTVPDVPVGTFELTLPQGPFSALTANAKLCTPTKTVAVKRKVAKRLHGRIAHRTLTTHVKEPVSLLMPTYFWAQNGAQFHQSTKIAVTGCLKMKKAKKVKKKAAHKRGKKPSKKR